MWYYQKDDKTKEGPIADPALERLFEKGVVKTTTRVWTQGQSGWTEFGKTQFFRKITAPHHNRKKADFVFKTRVLRAIIGALVVFLGAQIMLTRQMVNIYQFDIPTIGNIDDMAKALLYNEKILTLNMSELILKGLYVALFVMLAGWIASLVRIAKSYSSSMLLSSRLSALGCFAPIANIVIVPMVLRKVCRSLERSTRGKRSLAAFVYVWDWTFLWAIMWLSIFVANYFAPAVVGLYVRTEVYDFAVYSKALQIATWLAAAGLFTYLEKMIVAGRSPNSNRRPRK